MLSSCAGIASSTTKLTLACIISLPNQGLDTGSGDPARVLDRGRFNSVAPWRPRGEDRCRERDQAGRSPNLGHLGLARRTCGTQSGTARGVVDDAKQFEAALSASARGQGGRRVGVAGLADSNATSEALSAALHAAHARVQMERRIASAERRSDAERLARSRGNATGWYCTVGLCTPDI